MSTAWRQRGTWLAAICVAIGCDPGRHAGDGKRQSSPTVTAVVAEQTPGVVELLSAQTRLTAENVVYFEVAYRFTSGLPTKTYRCEINFPGTKNHGIAPLEAWELKPKGVIKTGIEVSDQSVQEYSITLSEADSPDRGYKLISNTLIGEINRPSAKE